MTECVECGQLLTELDQATIIRDDSDMAYLTATDRDAEDESPDVVLESKCWRCTTGIGSLRELERQVHNLLDRDSMKYENRSGELSHRKPNPADRLKSWTELRAAARDYIPNVPASDVEIFARIRDWLRLNAPPSIPHPSWVDDLDVAYLTWLMSNKKVPGDTLAPAELIRLLRRLRDMLEDLTTAKLIMARKRRLKIAIDRLKPGYELGRLPKPALYLSRVLVDPLPNEEPIPEAICNMLKVWSEREEHELEKEHSNTIRAARVEKFSDSHKTLLSTLTPQSRAILEHLAASPNRRSNLEDLSRVTGAYRVAQPKRKTVQSAVTRLDERLVGSRLSITVEGECVTLEEKKSANNLQTRIALQKR